MLTLVPYRLVHFDRNEIQRNMLGYFSGRHA